MPPSNKNNKRRSLYNYAKNHKLDIKWKTSTKIMQKAIDNYKKSKANKIISLFRKSKYKSDKNFLNTINNTSNKLELTLSRFNNIRRFIKAPADKKLLLNVKNDEGIIIKSFNLNDREINTYNLFVTEQNEYSSGADFDIEILPSSMLELEWINNPKYSKSERKNFFRYLLLAEYLQLNYIQVYSKFKINLADNEINFDPETSPDSDAINYPCFLFALLKAGLDAKIVKQISQSMFNTGATIQFIRKTASTFNITISIKQYRINATTGLSNSKVTIYGDKNSKTIYKLGSVGEHLFAILPTKITKAALNNQKLIDEYQRTDFIITKNKVTFNNKKIKFLDTYTVVSHLYHYRETLLTPITQRNMPNLIHSKYQEVRSLCEEDFDKKHFKQLGLKRKEGNDPFKVYSYETKKFESPIEFNCVYIDIETYVKGIDHIPYCISYSFANVYSLNFHSAAFRETKCIYGLDCIQKFLDLLPKNSYNLLWAHNLGFDYRPFAEYLSFKSNEVNVIDSGTKIKLVNAFYKGRTIVFKDTLSFIPAPLAALPSMFNDSTSNISLEKECFPHHLINETNYNSLWPIEYLESYADMETLLNNAAKIGAINGNFFDCQKYATHYCNRDVDVLRNCFESFRRLVFDQFKLDVYKFLSISSVSLAYQNNEGCFDDCYEVNSIMQGFMRQAIVGGRCMTRDNEKHHIKHKLADFDAVSLYPSAMAEMPGYVKGIPKLFKETIPQDADFYIAKIRVNSIGIKRHFPLQSIQMENSRNFTNDIENKEIILGKQALEDLIEFQKADVTIIEGAYWNDGFNDKICSIISDMFQKRLIYKKQGNNGLQQLLKLMMNSSYGKLLMKPITTQKKMVSGDQDTIEQYTRKNIHKMIARTRICDRTSLFEEHKCLTSHYSPVHLGVQVLDSSKHIMNRVMCLAEDLDADIWYIDTDSMHIDYDQVPVLQRAYKEKYNKELIGKQMSQFHTDFDLKGSEGEIYAFESIFLGKKSYLDLLACDGNDVTGSHIRCKGIPSKLLEDDTYQKYIDLYNGKTLRFDLSEVCPININSKTQKITKRQNFYRNISF